MKHLIFTLFLAGIFFAGCSDFNSSNVPANSQSTVQKVKMPSPKNLSIETVFTVSKNIVGNIGGELLLDGAYASTSGTVTIDAELNVPGGAYKGSKVLAISNVGEYVEVSLNPSMQFDSPVLLSVRMEGLDLSDVSPEQIQFLYFADDGSTEPVVYDQLIVDVQNGILEVQNAQLNHFSRYGFAK